MGSSQAAGCRDYDSIPAPNSSFHFRGEGAKLTKHEQMQ